MLFCFIRIALDRYNDINRILQQMCYKMGVKQVQLQTLFSSLETWSGTLSDCKPTTCLGASLSPIFSYSPSKNVCKPVSSVEDVHGTWTGVTLCFKSPMSATTFIAAGMYSEHQVCEQPVWIKSSLNYFCASSWRKLARVNYWARVLNCWIERKVWLFSRKIILKAEFELTFLHFFITRSLYK